MSKFYAYRTIVLLMEIIPTCFELRVSFDHATVSKEATLSRLSTYGASFHVFRVWHTTYFGCGIQLVPHPTE